MVIHWAWAALSLPAELVPGCMEACGASSDCVALATLISSSVPGLGYSHASGASTMLASKLAQGPARDHLAIAGNYKAHLQLGG